MTVAIYDGKCVICNQSRRIYTALDWFRQIEWLDLHNWDEVSRRYPSLSYDTCMGQMHLVTPDGQLLGGFPAARRTMRDLPLLVPVWLLLHLPGMNWLGDKVYRFIARNRYRVNQFFGVDICEDGVCKLPS